MELKIGRIYFISFKSVLTYFIAEYKGNQAWKIHVMHKYNKERSRVEVGQYKDSEIISFKQNEITLILPANKTYKNVKKCMNTPEFEEDELKVLQSIYSPEFLDYLKSQTHEDLLNTMTKEERENFIQ